MESIKVAVVEGDEIFLRGLVATLGDEDFDCIVLGVDQESSPEAISAERDIDVAVVSHESLGSVRLSCPIVVLARPELAGRDLQLPESNVRAILPHEGLSGEELAASVRAAAVGLQVGSPNLSRREQGEQVLDPRRIDVLRLLSQGADTRAIARKLGISERTVKSLVRDIQLTLGATNRAQAVAEGMRLGLI